MRVTVNNFRRAETDTYFARFVKDGGFGRLKHEREFAPIDRQSVIRLNRDTLYSFGVFDLDAGPVTVTLPDAGSRYMAVQVIDQDQYATDVFYAPGVNTLTKEKVGTRYVTLAVRTFVNPNDAADVKAVHALQDAIKIEQKAAGKFEIPDWNQASLKAVREALLAPAAANGGIDSVRMFGRRGEVDPVQHLIGTAAGWGGNPPHAALYAGAEPQHNDGKTAYQLTVKDVPVDGFWSGSVYNKKRLFREERAERLYRKQCHRQAKRRRFGDDPIRRRRRCAELPPHQARLELRRSDVPSAAGNHGRRLEVSGGPAGAVTCKVATPN